MTINITLNGFCFIGLIGKSATSLSCLARILFDNQIATDTDFSPSIRIEHIIKFLGDWRFISARFFQIRHCQSKLAQTCLYFLPFRRESIVENFQCMAITIEFKFILQIEIYSHCWRLMRTARGLAPS